MVRRTIAIMAALICCYATAVKSPRAAGMHMKMPNTAKWDTAAPSGAKSITIRIGIQEMCTDTYPAGTIIMCRRLLQRYLPHTGKYAGVAYNIKWRNYDSGGPLTNMMIAGKLDFGTMGDYPLVVNGAKFQAAYGVRSKLITLTAYNLDGAGNSVVVPTSSAIQSAAELEGKAISVPVGSAAWGMLYVMAKHLGVSINDFKIINQSPMVGISAIAEKRIAAHADFCPMSEYMEFYGTGRMVYSGAETGIPYLHGAVVTAAFAKKYPEIVTAYCEAVLAADRWLVKNPLNASRMIAQWTMIPRQVLYLYFSKGGYLIPDPTLKPQFLKTLAYDHSVLAKYAGAPPLNMKRWVDDQYLVKAYKKMGLSYHSQLKTIYSPLRNIGLPVEMWVNGHGVVAAPTISALLGKYKQLVATGDKISAVYVYDQTTGIKLFGRCSYFVKKNGTISAYMTLREAEMAAAGKGLVLTWSKLIRRSD